MKFVVISNYKSGRKVITVINFIVYFLRETKDGVESNLKTTNASHFQRENVNYKIHAV